ncbi:phosphatase PAP2 family protein [Metabacillus herbersteinensis]|uniref:Phosphatase PAP2 family protein n=1 Tax=Metabacillus herbersteinensis TaxID=283816 RepID=A0ABV6GJA1_9BACI
MRNLEKRRNLYIWTAAALSIFFIGLFITVAKQMTEQKLDHFDQVTIEFIQGFISDHLTLLMSFLTFLGGTPWLSSVVIVVAIGLWMQKNPLYGTFIVFASGIGGLVNKFLKWLFQRERPDHLSLIVEHGYSFPSGHSMGSMIFYGTLVIVAVKVINKKAINWFFAIGSGLLIASIGISRIYLGVHYPSDVLAGFATGLVWIAISSILLEYAEYRLNKREKGIVLS